MANTKDNSPETSMISQKHMKTHNLQIDNNKLITDVECIGLDADDTLWENEKFYHNAELQLQKLMEYKAPADEVYRILFETESGNMECLGYGAKAMTISMIEAAIRIDPEITPDKILQITEFGKELLKVPTQLFGGVLSTVRKLQKKYRVIIVTKGELNEQIRKIRNSPFKNSTEYYVLETKTVDSYSELLKRLSINPKKFMMVGNSPKSDILPILHMGGRAVYIPQMSTWAHELEDLPPSSRLSVLKSFKELTKILPIS